MCEGQHEWVWRKLQLCPQGVCIGSHRGSVLEVGSSAMDVISLPVNDDWVRGRLVSVAATFLLATAAEWAVRERERERKSVS